MIKNIIWDFDGTLFDTYPFMVTSFCKALQELGIDEIEIDPDEIYNQMRVYSLGSAITKYSARFGINKDELLKIYQEIEQDEIELAKPFEGVELVLQQVVNNGGKNVVLTHRNNQTLALLKQYGLDKLFATFITSDNHLKRKPDPEALNYIIHTLELKRDETAMLGDRELDVQAGENAALTTILFDPDYLIDIYNADYIIRNYHDILKNIK